MISKDLGVKLTRSLIRVFTLTFVFGLILWSVQLRLMEVSEGASQSRFVLVLLTDVDENSQVVFQYPHVESPTYLGRVSKFTEGKGFLLKSRQGIHLPRELILGHVLYEF